jgi:hypothetical protein
MKADNRDSNDVTHHYSASHADEEAMGERAVRLFVLAPA